MSYPKSLEPGQRLALLDSLLPKDAPHRSFVRGVRNYTMAMMMLETGVRVGELVQLLMTDAYWQSVPVKSIIIRPEIGKGGKSREIPVSVVLSGALNEYRKHYGLPESVQGETPLFYSGPYRKPLTTRQVERIIRAAGLESIGQPIHPHVLRHTFASRLMRKAPIRVVQELLGHKHLSSTQIYTHVNGDDLRRAIDSPD